MVQNPIKHWVFATNTKTRATWGTTVSTSSTCRRWLNHTFILFGLVCPYSDEDIFSLRTLIFPAGRKQSHSSGFTSHSEGLILPQTPGAPWPVLTISRGTEGSMRTQHRLVEGTVAGTSGVH